MPDKVLEVDHMSEYVILTDSSADLTDPLVKELGVEVLPLTFTVQGSSHRNYPDNRDMAPKEFYRLLRSGEMATTAAVNVSDFSEIIDSFAQAGKDVLILAFSSGLSATYSSAAIAAEEMREKYPERSIYAVDTLCASMGQAMLIWLTAQEKKKGKTIQEALAFAEETKLHICHWFTVDDLHFLKRGGRVSAATAVVGSMLSIKPVLHVDNDGHLINMSKARGRKASLLALVDKIGESAIKPETQTMFLSHGDCLEDAQFVADEAMRRYHPKEVIISNVGPVIGAHSGPGTVALFFVGTQR